MVLCVSYIVYNCFQIPGAAHFRRGGRAYASKKVLSSSYDNNLNTLENVDGASRTSLDSTSSSYVEPQNTFMDFSAFEKLRDKIGSIVKSGPQESSDVISSSAGLLMSSEGKGDENVQKSQSNQIRELTRQLSRIDEYAGDSGLMSKLQQSQDNNQEKVFKILNLDEEDEGFSTGANEIASSQEELDGEVNINSPTK